MTTNPEGQRCETCRYFRTAGEAPERTSAGAQMQPGWCYRFPPSAAQDVSRFPRVFDTTWCGEWSPAAPQTLDEGATTLARLVLLGDLTAARALADRLREGES